MAILTRSSVVTNGLVLNLDSLNPQSLPVDPTVNLLYTSSTYTPSTQNLTLYTSSSIIIPNSYFRITSSTFIPPYTGGSLRLNIPLNVLANGKPYTLSYKYQIVSGSQFQMNDWCDTTLTNVVDINYGSYRYASATGTRTTYDATFRFMDFNMSENTIVDIWDMQLVQNTYSPLFTTSSLTIWQNLARPGNNTVLTSSSLSGSIPQYNYLNERVLNFDGIGSYANTGLDLRWGTGSSVSIEMWLKNGLSSTSGPFIGTTNYMWQIRQGIDQSPSTAITYVYWDSTGNHTNGPVLYVNNFFDGGWKHLTMTWDSGSSTTSLYKNGVLQTAQTSSNAAVNRNVADTVKIGGNIYGWGAGTNWSGSISNVKIYNRTLTAQEVQQNYNALKTRFGLT